MKPIQVEVTTKEITFEDIELQNIYETLSNMNKNYESLVEKLQKSAKNLGQVNTRKRKKDNGSDK